MELEGERLKNLHSTKNEHFLKDQLSNVEELLKNSYIDTEEAHCRAKKFQEHNRVNVSV